MADVSLMKHLVEYEDFGFESWKILLEDENHGKEYAYARTILEYIKEERKLNGIPLKMFEILSKNEKAKEIVEIIKKYAKKKGAKI